ncbi:uncharacterized protein C4orf54 homolog [Poecilia latipinna]|nr:PREDICTED: uncharacterized protein LOC106940000 [Poecilia latipinna]XP_014878085.1 PREDICTED: uncharacterized protein LOC106940000 [Poecilia latipinna]XP_014878086.1 PREDICTED: uncharacterized protein LOC106940000 [Poecilia latipinna]
MVISLVPFRISHALRRNVWRAPVSLESVWLDAELCAQHHLWVKEAEVLSGPSCAASFVSDTKCKLKPAATDMKTKRRCTQKLAASGQVIDLLQKGKQNILKTQDETRYVDLESEDEKVCRFGQRSQVSVIAKNGGFEAVCASEPNSDLKEMHSKEGGESTRGEKCMKVVRNLPSPSSSPCLKKTETSLQIGEKSGESTFTYTTMSKGMGSKADREEESHSTNSYLSGRSECEDCEEVDNVSLVLSDESALSLTEDHYITTHEIQLSEFSDHEGDYDLGVGSSTSWDIEDENQVYPFIGYSFAGETGACGAPCSKGAAAVAAAVSTLLESDLSDAAKFCSSDDPEQKQGEGQIHMSIRTTSRAINDPGSIQEEENILCHARRSGDMRRYVFRGVDGKAETLCDSAKCFIAAPGRPHFGGRLRGKEVTEYSSGTSSAVSELDDADKEVRNLTAKAFKSLAYPYFEAINFSTSSESSASEHGRRKNTWSTFLDLKYGNVNMSQGLDQSVISCQNPAASYEIGKNSDNRGYKGTIKPTTKIFALKANPRSTSSSKQIQLMGKFGQGHSGVIRLTETLNFCCNVKSGMSGEERRTNFAQNAAGSCSTDDITKSLQSSQQRGASKLPSKTMEDTHKKAIFASSLLKNVLSKKMQFEQERRMERGEISEPHQAPSPGFVLQESNNKWKGNRELERQSSKFSERGCDYAIMCVDELGDFVDSGSCDSKRQDACAPATETNLNSANEAGIDTKKGALHRSQNSAFRCWKDEELEFQKDHKNHQTLLDKLPPVDDKESEWDPFSASCGKLTKMSHLFVPSIQLLPSDREVRPQLQRGAYSWNGSNTLYITDSRSSKSSKSPEIKINLRSVKDNKMEEFGGSKLRASNITASPSSLIRKEDFKCQTLAAALKGESSDKIPHFMVRDIRDNKGKLQTPIHQVRDVRKLVKSSYHLVSLDKNKNKSNSFSSEIHSEQKKQMQNSNPNCVSPMVIKCQSVNTNNVEKPTGNLKQEQSDTCRSSPEGVKSAPPQKASGRAANTSNSSEGNTGMSNEGKTGATRQETVSETAENKPESKVTNQVALEKLQAAVKTMEQLYVFDKNEWRRKSEPERLTDSHVLSLIASEEQQESEERGGRGFNTDKAVRRDSYPNIDKTHPALSAPSSTDSSLRWLDKDLLKVLQSSNSHDERLVTKSVQTVGTIGSKSMSSFSSKSKAYTAADVPQSNTAPHTPFSGKSFAPKSPKLPVSFKTSQTGVCGKKDAEPRGVNRFEHQFSGASVDNENYLTIPVKFQPNNSKMAATTDKTSKTLHHQSLPTPPAVHEDCTSRVQEDYGQRTKRSSIVMETHSPEIPSATIYHSLPMAVSANQPQMYCFSPAITPAPTLDPFQATQRKMLLDPTTGNYYLVDTLVSPATKRLFDPETRQYVDVPMPQPPVTPVPMPISPLALSPGAYGHTYMIYPGFMPTPSVIPPRTLVQSQMSVPSEVEGVEKSSSQQSEGMYMESPFYMATTKPPQAASGAQQHGASNRLPHGCSSMNQPVISISSQQGPRIIAPPSFDGTTMSFVVEHR